MEYALLSLLSLILAWVDNPTLRLEPPVPPKEPPSLPPVALRYSLSNTFLIRLTDKTILPEKVS